MKPSLFEIAREYRSDVEKLGDMDLPDEVIADTLESMGGELAVKGRNVAAFAADLDTMATAMKEAERRMKARREAVERRAERLRHYLMAGMQYAGVERIDGPDFCVSIKKNPAAVEVFDQAQLPEMYFKQAVAVTVNDAVEVGYANRGPGVQWVTISGPREAFTFTETPIKDAIKTAIKGGQEVPGCKLIQGVRLVIE